MRPKRRGRWAAGLVAVAMAGVVAVFLVGLAAWWWRSAAEDRVVERSTRRAAHREIPHRVPGRRVSPPKLSLELPLRTPTGELREAVGPEADSGETPWESLQKVPLYGLVVDSDGDPVAGAAIWIELDPYVDGAAAWRRPTMGGALRVDENGVFETEVPPGSVRVGTSRRDGGIEYPCIEELWIEPTDEEAEVTLVLPAERIGGLGVSFRFDGGEAVILAAIPGTAGAELGLGRGDAIVAIDGEAVAGMDEQDFVSRIAGPEGSLVVVSLRIGDAVEEHTIVRTYIQDDEDGAYGVPVPGMTLVDPDTGAPLPGDSEKAPILSLDTGSSPDTGD